MKSLLFALSMSLMASGAYAADAVIEDMAAPGFVWTGGYVGVHAGYVWQDFELFGNDGSEGGFLGGLYFGYNHQMANNVVLGAEADFGFGALDFDPEEVGVTDYTAIDTRWNGHLRGRVGYAVDRALFFVAAGAAFANVKMDDTDDGYGDDSQTYVGWTIGGGMDYAVTDNLIFRAEYLYDDFGSETFLIPDSGSGYDADFDLSASTVRVGLAYKF